MIDKDLLAPFFEAKAFLVYGPPGTRKTNGIHTLPPPILHLDKESGDSSIIPWQRRKRKFNEVKWRNVTDEQRQGAFDALSDDNKKFVLTVSKIRPAPLIDTVVFDSLDPESWEKFVETILNFQPTNYNSIVLDSLQETTLESQSFVKGQAKMSTLAPMHVSLWTPAQHRTNLIVHKIKNIKDMGVFVYMTCSEFVDKDYVTDPRSATAGSVPEQPYSVKGAPNVPGQLVGAIQHVTDIMCHSRAMNGETYWISEPEPFSGGSTASWEAKDRTGRLKSKFNRPSFKSMISEIYGQSAAETIYKSGYDLVRTQLESAS